MEYTHKGVAIKLDPKQGDFVAALGGVETHAPSLSAMKKRIDQNGKATFQPFAAIGIDDVGWGEDMTWKLVEFKVTGMVVGDRASKYHAQKLVFTTDSKKRYDTVILDTPANRKVAAAMMAHDKETQRITKQRAAEREALDDKFEKRKCPQKSEGQ